MTARGRAAASQVFIHGGLTLPPPGSLGKMKEMRPLTQLVRMISESNALINGNMYEMCGNPEEITFNSVSGDCSSQRRITPSPGS